MTQNLNITIDPEVHAYLNKKKRTILALDLLISGGGCCPTFEVADIAYKKPENEALYNSYNIEEIEIYISKKVIVRAPVLRFSLEKMGMIKQIVPKGLSLKK